MSDTEPRVLVFSSLFPHAGQPMAGLFIRERMFRVGRHLPLVVVSPRPWFPLQSLIRIFRPGYRPDGAEFERQQEFDVYRPRFLAVPGIGRRFDGMMMAVGCWWLLRRLKKDFNFTHIDAHFAYPDGYAATKLAQWFDVTSTITMRGTEVPHARIAPIRKRMVAALKAATRVFSVSDSLRRFAVSLGVPADKTQVIGNGVDLNVFSPVDRNEARASLGLPPEALVLISVGALVPRKGFHRVIEVLPALRRKLPNLHYLCVGGASPEGNFRAELERQVHDAGLDGHVHFTGAIPPAELRRPLSAADVFVLSTSNEGWANVFLEAMACGLPVVTTDVGGNAEVVCRPELGTLVSLGDGAALERALVDALTRQWNRPAILDYAADNAWDKRVNEVVSALSALTGRTRQDQDPKRLLVEDVGGGTNASTAK